MRLRRLLFIAPTATSHATFERLGRACLFGTRITRFIPFGSERTPHGVHFNVRLQAPLSGLQCKVKAQKMNFQIFVKDLRFNNNCK